MDVSADAGSDELIGEQCEKRAVIVVLNCIKDNIGSSKRTSETWA